MTEQLSKFIIEIDSGVRFHLEWTLSGSLEDEAKAGSYLKVLKGAINRDLNSELEPILDKIGSLPLAVRASILRGAFSESAKKEVSSSVTKSPEKDKPKVPTSVTVETKPNSPSGNKSTTLGSSGNQSHLSFSRTDSTVYGQYTYDISI